ncbi:MAG: molybdopterin oxidoreductase, partial [Chloroflexi bacterium]|nr:molybdopterin oxidoreductase [Chloroflexota bacterium]
RFLIIIPGLARKQMFTFDWGTFRPSPVEIIIIFATFALVTMLMLLFSRVLPLIPLYDIKEGDILKTEIQIGRRTVPATFRED